MRMTKKAVSIVLAVMMVVAMMSVMAVSASATEAGTPISTSEELYNACRDGGEYYLTQNIDMLHYYYIVRNDVTIHGNGYTITAYNNGSVHSYDVFVWYDNSHASLTIDDVTLDGANAAECAVNTMCSTNKSVCPNNNDNADCKVTMTGCTVQNFVGFSYVGAVYIFAYAEGEFNNCTFTNNTTQDTESPYQGSDIWGGGGTKLTINGGNYSGTVYGNASGSVGSTVTIENATVNQVTLGATSQAGADVTFVNSNVATVSVEDNNKSDVNVDKNSTLTSVADFGGNDVKEEAVTQNVITTAAELVAAATAGGNWILGADIVISDVLNIPNGLTLTLNLNGHDISGNVDAKMIQNHGNLTINDTTSAPGHIYNTNMNKQGNAAVVNYEDGVATINNGYYGDSDSDMTNANNINRGAGFQNYGTATVNGGYFTALDNFVNGGWAYAIINYGAIVINDATVYGHNNGNLCNNTGSMTVNGGNYTLTKGTEQNYYSIYNNDTSATTVVNDGTFTNTTGTALTWSPAGSKIIKLNGGDYTYTKFVQSGSPVVSGGTFSKDVDVYAADGYVGVQNANGTYGVGNDNNITNGKADIKGYQNKIVGSASTSDDGNDISTKGVRILTKVDNEFLETCDDYGYVVAKVSGKAQASAKFNLLTADKSGGNGQKVISCKGTVNHGIDGVDNTYVTLAVNGMNAGDQVAARFYVVKDGTYYSYYVGAARYNGIIATMS